MQQADGDDEMMTDEQNIISLALKSRDAIDRLSPLSVDDFYFAPYAAIWKAVLSLQHSGHWIDPASVVSTMAEMVGAEQAEIYKYSINSITMLSIDPEAAEDLSSRVRSRAIARRIKAKVGALAALCEGSFAERDSPASIIALAREIGVLAAGGSNMAPAGRSMAKVTEDTLDFLEDLWGGKLPPPVPSGLPKLDACGVIIPGYLVLIGARPSTGKSALAAQMARISGQRGVRSIFFSLEMSAEMLAVRNLAQVSAVNMMLMTRANRGGVTDEERMKIYKAAGPVAKTTTRMIDWGDMSIDAICALARSTKVREGLDVVYVDYLQLVPVPAADNGRMPRHEVVGLISRKLKLLARELDVAVVACCQLNRTADGQRPSLSDLRESGSLEQDADGVVFLSADLEGGLQFNDWINGTSRSEWCDVAKNRNGPTRSFKVVFNTPTQNIFEEAH